MFLVYVGRPPLEAFGKIAKGEAKLTNLSDWPLSRLTFRAQLWSLRLLAATFLLPQGYIVWLCLHIIRLVAVEKLGGELPSFRQITCRMTPMPYVEMLYEIRSRLRTGAVFVDSTSLLTMLDAFLEPLDAALDYALKVRMGQEPPGLAAVGCADCGVVGEPMLLYSMCADEEACRTRCLADESSPAGKRREEAARTP